MPSARSVPEACGSVKHGISFGFLLEADRHVIVGAGAAHRLQFWFFRCCGFDI